ncbi:MAG: E3 ubiquitin- protein ligase upl1 [Trizodia sp. TS-e1964]|nr:MAG: E3 ubiquitin- protein ligase upl1 [Trizodia sp. TS-e1964]
MGKIKKAAGPKHAATLPPAINTFIQRSTKCALWNLRDHLRTFPSPWPHPRGDLYHWIPLLNRFDNILEMFCKEYALSLGPQTQPFERRLLKRGDAESNKEAGLELIRSNELLLLGFGPEGDRELVEAVLSFSKMLMENCGNRSLYSSSGHLNDLLNTTSLPLLLSTLRLAFRLAQRYHTSRLRTSGANLHVNSALLLSHYNIDLERILKIALPFTKSTTSSESTPTQTTAERTNLIPTSSTAFPTIPSTDLIRIAKGDLPTHYQSSADHRPLSKDNDGGNDLWNGWGRVCLTYYNSPQSPREPLGSNIIPIPPIPSTPTPLRRVSNLGQQASRASPAQAPNVIASSVVSTNPAEPSPGGGAMSLEISLENVLSTPVFQLLKFHLPNIPKEYHYELLHRLRVASALISSNESRQQILAIRLLAITNLAYIHPDALFQQKLLQQDSDEPRRLQLAYQLAELVHPPGETGAEIPRWLQSIALSGLEALAKHKVRLQDVCSALSFNVNHGVLLYVMRKAVAEIALEDGKAESPEDEEWREALFSLLSFLPSSSIRNPGESLVSAGMLPISVELLNLRTHKAQRYHPKILSFFETFIYHAREAFQALANAKGLDAISDLTAYEVRSAFHLASTGKGISPENCSQTTDYQIPFFHQQTLRALLKFMNHMMAHTGGSFDRLVRNLMDSRQLLEALRSIISNAKVFGAVVWSGAVNVLNSFIHNEPTSYAVIAEAGLSQAFLESVTGREFSLPAPSHVENSSPLNNDQTESGPSAVVEEVGDDGDEESQEDALLAKSLQVFTTSILPPNEKRPLADGIIPSSEAISAIPQAFGAICLNSSGMKLFQASSALKSFFEIFESPEHVKCMLGELELAKNVGVSFDELVRHHPRLKKEILHATLLMVAKVVQLCRSRATNKGVGAKILFADQDEIFITGGRSALGSNLTLASDSDNPSQIIDEQGDIQMSGFNTSFDSAPVQLSDVTERENEKDGPSVATYIFITTKFLAGMFTNQQLCSAFVQKGGAELLLDFATLPSLPYDFSNHPASDNLARVFRQLVEQKPHLVLPPLIKRSQKFIDQLKPLTDHRKDTAFFAPLISPNFGDSIDISAHAPSNYEINKREGTTLAKSLVAVHTLCIIMVGSFTQPIYNQRSSPLIFSQVNLTDMYVVLIKSLGSILKFCVWEENLIHKSLPDRCKDITRVKAFGKATDDVEQILGSTQDNQELLDQDVPEIAGSPIISEALEGPVISRTPQEMDEAKKTVLERDANTHWFRNVRVLRFILTRLPYTISPLFQSIGKILLPKRTSDGVLKQNATLVSDAIAESIIDVLKSDARSNEASTIDQYAYWVVALSATSKILLEGPLEKPHPQIITLVLQSFKSKGGFEAISEILVAFSEGVIDPEFSLTPRFTTALGGMKIILNIYAQLVAWEHVMDSTQSIALNSRDRDKEKPDYFSPIQFLVELRMAILPKVRSMWDSDLMDKLSSPIAKALIDILRTILEADKENENNAAYRRSDKIYPRRKPRVPSFKINSENLAKLRGQGYSSDLGTEALYRCNNSYTVAQDYCAAQKGPFRFSQYPTPLQEARGVSSHHESATSRSISDNTILEAVDTAEDDGAISIPPIGIEAEADDEATTNAMLLENPQAEIEEADGDENDDEDDDDDDEDDADVEEQDEESAEILPPPPPVPGAPLDVDFADNEGLLAMSIDGIVGGLSNLDVPITGPLAESSAQANLNRGVGVLSSTGPSSLIEAGKCSGLVTLDDLDDERAKFRKTVIDRSLDVLTVHSNLSFELADLIFASVKGTRSIDSEGMRKEIGETLVQSLISLQDEDFRPSGKKVAAYAHLLGLILQDKNFYEATMEEIKQYFSVLLGFIKIYPEQSAEESSPWISHILLITERLLAEDSQPKQIQWSLQSTATEPTPVPITEISEPVVTLAQKTELFDAIIEVLPKIGKDEVLALSVARTLVILTRNRYLATRLGQKRNMQRFFVMIKQLAGITTEKLQSSIMMILRHIIEDDETIKQIMRSEIKALFDTRRERATDTQSYIKNASHLILRAPDLFVQTTNEMLKISRFIAEQRIQQLELKSEASEPSQETKQTTNASEENKTTEKPAEDIKKDGEQNLSTDQDDRTMPDRPNGFPNEIKGPIENSDGVIHYLLCELLSYKEVDDKEPPVPKPTSNDQPAPQVDVEMSHGDITLPTAESKKSGKATFKADNHPIYIYRCFILQCLTELLSCYNRIKMEFINFSRKSLLQAMTPTKPRTGVLNYLLNDLIPVGTLLHPDDISYRKKYATSNWAISVIVSLCAKTAEKIYDASQSSSEVEPEPELLFVRKFVLEHALKAYRDAYAMDEPLDSKYSRMLNLADLFDRILTGKPNSGGGSLTIPMLVASQTQLAKIMFEKGFINAFTNSLADIDLNFPGTKRAVKHILRPLKHLTETALKLSESSSISTNLAQTEEDEISVASSVSEFPENREETPDLFRNSTLGMFDPGREEESSSESSNEDDEEMFEDEFAEDIEYEADLAGVGDDLISDEDEEIEEMVGDVGVDVEVIINDEGEDEDQDSDDEEDDDDDDEEDSDDMDEDELEAMGDMVAADGIESDRDDEQEWQSEEDDDGDVDVDFGDIIMQAQEMEEFDPGQLDNPLHEIVRVLDEGRRHEDLLQRIEDGDLNDGPDMGEDDMPEDDDEEEDDEDMDDDEMVYAPDFADPPNFSWGLDSEGDAPPMLQRGPPHHHRVPNPWTMFPAAARDMLGELKDFIVLASIKANSEKVPPYRSHRHDTARNRGNETGANPLLERNTISTRPHSSRFHEPMNELVHAMDPSFLGRGGVFQSNTIISDIISAMSSGGSPIASFDPGRLNHAGGALHFHVTTTPNGVNRGLLNMISMRRPHLGSHRNPMNDPVQAVNFIPMETVQRWQDEARLLFGLQQNEKATRILNSLLKLMVPPALEEEKIRKQKAAEEAKRLQAEKEKKAADERIAKEEAERIEREKREAEELEAASKLAAEVELAAASALEETLSTEESPTVDEESKDGEPMEGIELTDAGSLVVVQNSNADVVEATPSAPPERIYTNLRGQQIDITDFDIDPTYLEALPEELREEVVVQQLAERQSNQAVTGDQPTDISQEFLDALPEDIREELRQQEAQDRRRRDREEARRRAAANGGPAAQATDMDPASFLASLDPTLRQVVLMEQDEAALAQLPPAIAAEARALGQDRRMGHHYIERHGRQRILETENRIEQSDKKSQRKSVVQMLDKAGVATLLRLMFAPPQGSARISLHGILRNVCENRQNRAEVINLLLSILQDGSADMNAIERSFAYLSLRARSQTVFKTPPPAKRILHETSLSDSPEFSPLMVAQQCLSTLVFLTAYNTQIPSFFLSEHESPVGLKRGSKWKGKGRENKAARYPLNSLLGLLDRKLIIESSVIMDQLSSLLKSITEPLIMLNRKEKDKPQEEETPQEPSATASQHPIGNTSLSPTTPANETVEQINVSTADNLLPATTETQPPNVQPGSTTNIVPPENLETLPAGPSTSDNPAEEANKSENEKSKKSRTPIPPVVPEHNLRLVINILAARECSGKTFKDTLSTITNLSAIPEAKEVFGKELMRQAQILGHSILGDLEVLARQIKNAKSGTDIQAIALAKFSPAGSDQAKLLRVLTALDYLFDPKRYGVKEKREPVESSVSADKEDLLASFNEDSTFGPLWSRLSECLSAIHQRENMINVATILLPLIEALMVVCKNTSLMEPPPSIPQIRTSHVASPPPENRMDNLFFTFTEDHRKVLNELVRQNPKLMSGTFSLLVKNPKVLEFDNKRNYFSRRVHSRTEYRQPQPALQLQVRRDNVFLDSYRSLYFKTGDEIKFGKLSIRFHGEEGVDAGGVTREWFQVLSRQMFNPDYALFTPVASDRTTFHPNRHSSVNSEHLLYFKFIGRIIGKALYEGRVLDCHFSRAVYKRILGKPVSIKDMETLDLDYYKSLVWMLKNDITDIITETMSLESEAFGVTQIVDLVEGGRKVLVTEQNKEEYVRLVISHRLTGSVEEQLESFLKGFHDIIPAELISIFNEQELELLISGLPDIDVEDWRNNTEYQNYSAASSQIIWFWRAVRSFDKEERAKLLQFVTGTSKVPLNGFKELEGMNGFSRFNIHRDYGHKDRLPSSHTCFNQLDLPEYDSYEVLRKQLYTAMTAGNEYFGFA